MPPILGAIDVEAFTSAHWVVGVDRRCAGLCPAGNDNDQPHAASGDDGARHARCPKGLGLGIAQHCSRAEGGVWLTSTLRPLPNSRGCRGVTDTDSAKIIQGRPYADKNQLVSRHVVSEGDLRQDQGSRRRQAAQVVELLAARSSSGHSRAPAAVLRTSRRGPVATGSLSGRAARAVRRYSDHGRERRDRDPLGLLCPRRCRWL